ncbi:hypothetical protein E2K93_09515 [Thalassotalea sp. HSM 43]|uniref:hypothetical protein n=1 Tax=Thalassotalea sp. HSM 43 TaxID=2552945 RepID=UPI001081F9AA|nr:hypothetical protein [Thalassotalea sp. HSM 43]QBY04612.1 hypothetical protein E2K93_09515 [Thalassotalea sp. HSM 43]
MKKIIILISTLLTLSNNAWANGNCSEAEYRQFDFWLGQWQVTNKQNDNVSASKISSILDSCVILEEYQTPNGFKGKSLNMYDKQRKVWHQTWTDNSGLLLQLEGTLEGQSMVLKGRGKSAQGALLWHKISWTPNSDGSVRQHWQQSLDDGKTWATLFDGMYRKIKQ